ncbi:uncharacterized protein LOC142345733 [Convolutriloba macropyga]|uniref:uncharacterized protein LOC142345733 n=1 Tax=Convolutriloba macropyga TaxID=536237 RepID=UPI003F520910
MAVLFPFFYRQHGKPKLCLICIVVMYFLIFVHASPSLFMYRISSRGSCRRFMYEVVPESVDQFRRDTLLYFVGIVPTVLVFTFTAITIYKIRGQKGAAKKRSNTTDKRGNGQTRRENEMTRQMVVVSLLFGFLCLAYTACTVTRLNMDKSNPKQDALRVVMISLGVLFTSLTHTVNFFAYIIFGKKFRNTFLSILPICKRKSSNPKATKASAPSINPEVTQTTAT